MTACILIIGKICLGPFRGPGRARLTLRMLTGPRHQAREHIR